jgi:hypothetical protein
VQGRLWNEYLSIEISTVCGHCGRPMEMVIDSNLDYQVKNEGATPLIFGPSIDWATFSEPNIIHAY